MGAKAAPIPLALGTKEKIGGGVRLLESFFCRVHK